MTRKIEVRKIKSLTRYQQICECGKVQHYWGIREYAYDLQNATFVKTFPLGMWKLDRHYFKCIGESK